MKINDNYLIYGDVDTRGIQRAGRQTAAVLTQFASAHGMSCCFLSLNDPQGLNTVQVGPSTISVSGYARNKSQFTLAALRAADRHALLVIALHPHLAPVVAAMHLRSPKLRSIIFSHGIEVWKPLGWPRGSALRRADLVTAPSEDTARHLISDQGVSQAKVWRLAWGLDPEFENRFRTLQRPQRPASFPANSRIILTVGRWDPAERYKGADNLISALPQIRRTIPDVFLVLVGDGEDRPRLEELAREKEMNGYTRFLSSLTQEELFACYAHCDVFALPSSGEGFGLVFLEAMAHGKPVVGGAHGGIPDVIEDSVTGVLVPHGDIARLSSVLEGLLSDPERMVRLGARGCDRVQKLYTSKAFHDRMVQVLERALRKQL